MKKLWFILALFYILGAVIASTAQADDVLSVSGTTLLRNGSPFEVHGVKIDAFVAPKDWFQPNGEYPNPSLQHAYEHFGETELKYAQAYGANTIDFQVSQYGLDSLNSGTSVIKGRVAFSLSYVKELTDAVHLARSMGFMVLLTIADGAFCGNTINVSGLPTQVTLRAALNLVNLFKDDRGVMIEIFNEPYGDKVHHWKEYIYGDSNDYVGLNTIISKIRETGAQNLLVVEALTQNFSAYQKNNGRYPHGQINDPLSNELIFGVHPYFSFPKVGVTTSTWDLSFGDFSQTHPVFVSEWNQNSTKVGSEPKWCLPTSQGGLGAPLVRPLEFFHYLQDHHINGVIGWAFDQPRTIIRDFGAGAPWGMELGGTCGVTKGGIGVWLQDYFKHELPDVPNS